MSQELFKVFIEMKTLRSMSKNSKIHKNKLSGRNKKRKVINCDYIIELKDEQQQRPLDTTFYQFKLIVNSLNFETDMTKLISEIKTLRFTNNEVTTVKITKILVEKVLEDPGTMTSLIEICEAILCCVEEPSLKFKMRIYNSIQNYLKLKLIRKQNIEIKETVKLFAFKLRKKFSNL